MTAASGQDAQKRPRAKASPGSPAAGICRVGAHGLGVADIVAVARRAARVELAPELRTKLAAARVAIERAAERGDTVYGLTTALGAAVDTPLSAGDLADFQRRTLRARMVGVGPALPR